MPKVLESKVVFTADDQATPSTERLRKSMDQTGLSVDELQTKMDRLNQSLDEYEKRSGRLGVGGGGGFGRGATTGPATWETPGMPPGGSGPPPRSPVSPGGGPPGGGPPGGPGGPPGGPPTRGRPSTLIDLPDLPSKKQLELERLYRQYDKMGLFKSYDKSEAVASMVQKVFPNMSDDAARKYANSWLKQNFPEGEGGKGARGLMGGLHAAQMATQAVTSPGGILGGVTGLAGQGAGTIAGSMAMGGPLAGMLGGAALPLAGILGGAALLGGATLASMKLAEPYKQFQKQFGAFQYTFPGGWNALFQKMDVGAEFGYTPTETASQYQRLQRIAGRRGMEAVTPFQQMRWAGMEEANWMPFAAAAAQAGLGETEEQWNRIGKIIGVTVADKSNLVNLPRIMDQMAGLVGTFTESAGDLSETGLKELAILTKFGEQSGAAFLQGERGQRFWGNVAQTVGGSKEPHMEMLIYSILNRSPRFKALAAAEGIGETGRRFTPWEFELARTMEGAGRATLFEIATSPRGAEQRERLLHKMGLPPRVARKFRQLVEQIGTTTGLTGEELMKRTEEEFKATEKFDIKDLLMGPEELRATMAQTQKEMLDAGKNTAANAVEIEKKLASFVDRASPYLDFASRIVARMLGVRNLSDLEPPVRLGNIRQLRAGKSIGWMQAQIQMQRDANPDYGWGGKEQGF